MQDESASQGVARSTHEERAAAVEALAAAVAAQADKANADDGAASPLPIEDGVGLGVDIVEISRMKRILARSPRFKQRVYTETERIYCESCANPAVHYAMRFAAKEAVLKALGTGFSCGIAPADVEVDRNAAGRPLAVLHRKADLVAQQLGVRDIPLSLSYTHNEAVACAMAITSDSIRAAEERKDPMEELARQFKDARAMLDDLPVAQAADDAPSVSEAREIAARLEEQAQAQDDGTSEGGVLEDAIEAQAQDAVAQEVEGEAEVEWVAQGEADSEGEADNA